MTEWNWRNVHGRDDILLIPEEDYRKLQKEKNWAVHGGEIGHTKAQRHERVCHHQGLGCLGVAGSQR